MNNEITLKEMVAFMDSGREFSIAFVTYSTTTGKGGEWRQLQRVIKSGSRANVTENKTPQKRSVASKNPNHHLHVTRNLYNPINGEQIKVRLRLIRRFNGKTVIP